MTGDAVNGRNGCGARAGARTLNLLAAPLNAQILQVLHDGPKQQADLRRETSHPAQTTLRSQLRRLWEAGVVEKRRRNRFPGVLQYELSDAGRDLLPVSAALERWLAAAPEGPLELSGPTAKAAVKALAQGWSTSMLRVLAAKPAALTELDRVISSCNYPSLERRLAAMRLAGIVESTKGDGRGTPHCVTKWARDAVAPLMAAMHWERRHASDECATVGKLDIETTFLLAASLLPAPADACGSCRMTVELGSTGSSELAGLVVAVRGGRVVSRTTRLEADADAWVSGGLAAWSAALMEGDIASLEAGGDRALALTLAESLQNPLPSVSGP